jgi:hypothetical protein
MLGNLLKYELKGTAHFFLPLFAATLVVSIIIRLFSGLFGRGLYWISGLLIFIEVLLMVALAVMVLVITIQRFYKNLLGSEGYLMFTLPVSTHHNILSKLLAATLWNIGAGLAVMLSFLIMASYGRVGEMLGTGWQTFSNFLYNTLNLSPALLLSEWAIVSLICVACSILTLYLAMAIGQLANEHKFLASIGAFIGLQIVGSILTSILGGIVTTMPVSWARALVTWAESLSAAATVQLVTLMVAVSAIACGAIYYFLTHWLLKRKLNLS